MTRFPLRSVLAVWLALLLPGCGEEAAPPEPPARPVKTLTIGDSAAGAAFEYSGAIRPTQESEMAFEVPGRVLEFPVKEAQRVEEGEVLARLDPRDVEANLDQAQAKVSQAAKDVERWRYMYEQGVKPERELELRERNLAVLQAELATARKAVEDAVLRAPFDGVVARRLVEDYANVQAKQPVLILQDDSALEIRVAVPERDFAQLTPGLSLEERTRRARPRVVVSSLPDRSFPARVTEFSTTADPDTRTYDAVFEFDNPPDLSVLPGMTGKVVLTGPAAGGGALRIPARAVVADAAGEPHVWILDPESGTVAMRPVSVGPLSGDSIEVTSGLEPGDTIAVSGLQQLRNGLPVRPLEP